MGIPRLPRMRRAHPAALLLFITPIALFAALSTLHASRMQNEWKLVFEHPLPGKYEDFAFPDAQHGWLAHSSGEILHSADSGRTWTVQATGMGPLRSIDFIDARRGFAGTVNGQFHATTDGGVTWKNITSTLPRSTKGFCGITHVGQKVHVVGKYTGGAADYFFSPDGGKSWTVTDLLPQAQGLVDVMFLNDSVGFIGGMARSDNPGSGPAMILRTTNGGRTWREVFKHDGGRGFVWKLFRVTPNIIYASLQSQDGVYRVARSTNAGDTWQVLTVTTGRPAGPAIQGIGFLDENTGWVGGFFRGMYATSDGGKNWTQLQLPDGTVNRFEKVGNTMFTAGSRGVLRYEGAGKRATTDSSVHR